MEKIMLEFQTASKYVHFDPDLCTAEIRLSKNRQTWKQSGFLMSPKEQGFSHGKMY